MPVEQVVILLTYHSRFLWALYQIKMLWEDCTGEDSTDEAVYETLKKLPKDLNETYEQCLAKVNPDSKRMSLARRTLKWICVSSEPFQITELQEALAQNPDTGELGQGLVHKEEILTCCASLAFLEKDGSDEFVLLAHHSVRQFVFPLDAESAYRAAQVELGELCVCHLHRHRPVKQLVSHAESFSKSIAWQTAIKWIAITWNEFSITCFAMTALFVPMLTTSWLSLLFGMLCT